MSNIGSLSALDTLLLDESLHLKCCKERGCNKHLAKKTTHHPSLQITSDTAYFSRPNWPWCPLCRPLRLGPWVWLLGPAARRRQVGPSAAFHFRPGKSKTTKTEKTRDKWENMVSFCYKTHTISYVNTQKYFFKCDEQIPAPSKGWCLNPKGLPHSTPYHPLGTPWRVQVHRF